MAIFRRNREPVPAQVPQGELAIVGVVQLEQLINAPDSIEKVIEEVNQDLELFANSRKEAKECLAEASSKELQTAWRMDRINYATNSGLRPNVPITRAEVRAVKLARNEKDWLGRLNVSSKVARMKAGVEEVSMAGSLILADEVQSDVPTAATVIRNYTDMLFNSFTKEGSTAQFFQEMEQEVFADLLASYTAEEHAREKVLSTLLNYLGSDLGRWDDFSEWVQVQSAAGLRHLHTPEQVLLRILAEDIHDPQRGSSRAAHAELVTANESKLLEHFIEESAQNERPSVQQRQAESSIHFAETLLRTDRHDPRFVSELIEVKNAWPQELVAEFTQYRAHFADGILAEIAANVLPYDSKQLGHMPTPENVHALIGSIINFNDARSINLDRTVVESVERFARAVAEAEPKRTYNFFTGSLRGEAEVLTDERQEQMCLQLAADLGEGEKFIADLRKIMAAVRDNPFEKGWEKIKEAGRITLRLPSGDMTSAVYRVNVAHRRGLSTSTKAAKGVRVLFAQSGDDVVILGFSDHDSYDAQIKRLR